VVFGWAGESEILFVLYGALKRVRTSIFRIGI
jgi:hypothetical protein